MSNVFSIAVSGMNAAVTRFSNAVSNIVNASSTGRLPSSEGEQATSHMPTDVISLSNSVGDNVLGVRTEVVPREPAYRPAYSPNSPHANEQGLIAEPNIDIAAELVDTMMAELAYKASAKVIAAEKRNEETLLDVLR